MENGMKPVRWGVFPCARVLKNRWFPGFMELSGPVTAIASRSAEKARNWARDLNIAKAYGSYQQLLDDPEIDAVFIALPNSMHHEWVIKALQAGKHVLCDKPLALTAAEAQEMTKLAEANHLLLQEGFMYQYHSQFAQIQEWMDRDYIGQLKNIRATFSFNYNDPGNFRNYPQLGGGVLFDLGCYCVHLVRRFFPDRPLRVQGLQFEKDTGADWTTAALLEFSENRLAMLDCSFSYQGDRFLYLVGTKGQIYSPDPFNPKQDIVVKVTTQDDTVSRTFHRESLYASCIADFTRKIQQGKFHPSPARDSIANLAVMDAISLSARLHRPVEMTQTDRQSPSR